MDISTMDSTPREDLIAKARSLGVERAELMTRVELTDEIVRRSETDPIQQKRARGWLGVARDLVASVVESGLNLPDAAAVIRGERAEAEARGPTPVATVTLAEIYATQGHRERALAMLDEVLAREPEHEPAQRLRERLEGEKVSAAVKTAAVRDALESEQTPRPAAEPAVTAGLEPSPSPAEPVLEDAEVGSPPVEPTLVEPAASPSPAESDLGQPFAPTLPLPLPQEPAAELLSPTTAPDIATGKSEPQQVETTGPEQPLHERITFLLVRTPGPHPLLCWDFTQLALPSTKLQVVCYAFRALPTGAERSEVTLSVAEPRGSVELSTFDPTMVVRAALGVRTQEKFVPLAVASELAVEAGTLEVRFRPPLSTTHAVTAGERSLLTEFAG